MGQEADLGSLEEGKLADMVVLNSDPLLDVGNAGDIHLVIREGKVLRPEDILKL